MEKEVIVLTMSAKHHGYCVAGVDRESGDWVRLVSSNEDTHGALNDDHVTYDDGTRCMPLDIVRVEILRPDPQPYQPENQLIDEGASLEKVGQSSMLEVVELHQPESYAFILGNEWPYITEKRVGSVGRSLVLVEVDDLNIYNVEYGEKKRTKASFQYEGASYKDISVTDPDFFSLANSWHTRKAFLVMSLPDAPFPDDRYYKFIAKVFSV